MKERRIKLHHPKVVIPLTLIFSSLMCASIGFSAWNIIGGESTLINGDVDVERFDYNIIGVDCMTVTSLSLTKLTRYGFNVSSANPLTYEGAKATIQFDLNIATLATTYGGERLISSLSDTTANSKMNITVDFSAYTLTDDVRTPYSYNGVLSATAFTMSMVTSNTGITIARKSFTNGDSLNGVFKLTKVNLALTTVTIKSIITFSYIGSNFESFYSDVVSGNFKFLATLQAGEYEA